MLPMIVIPAQAGIQSSCKPTEMSLDGQTAFWIPAFAGMTKWEEGVGN